MVTPESAPIEGEWNWSETTWRPHPRGGPVLAGEAVPHRFGGTEYSCGRKEIGHVHDDRLADLPLPRKLHDEVIASGRAEPHHVLPGTVWVSCLMTGPEDAEGVIALLRIQYDRYRQGTAASRPV